MNAADVSIADVARQQRLAAIGGPFYECRPPTREELDAKIDAWTAWVLEHPDERKLLGLTDRAGTIDVREAVARIVDDELGNCRTAKNDRYQVACRVVESLDESWPRMVHLSIKRIDKEPIHDWRDLQEIKNAILGDEAEALELYPAESRRVDSANQYHLWCITSGRFPFGYQTRYVSEHDGVCGAKQRPFQKG